jgi:hypothetical protein
MEYKTFYVVTQSEFGPPDLTYPDRILDTLRDHYDT